MGKEGLEESAPVENVVVTERSKGIAESGTETPRSCAVRRRQGAALYGDAKELRCLERTGPVLCRTAKESPSTEKRSTAKEVIETRVGKQSMRVIR